MAGVFLQPRVGQKIALTSGDWEVLGRSLWVDPDRQLVYFMGLRESPLEKHLYVVSLRRPGEVRLLTRPGYSYSVDFNTVSFSIRTYALWSEVLCMYERHLYVSSHFCSQCHCLLGHWEFLHGDIYLTQMLTRQKITLLLHCFCLYVACPAVKSLQCICVFPNILFLNYSYVLPSFLPCLKCVLGHFLYSFFKCVLTMMYCSFTNVPSMAFVFHFLADFFVDCPVLGFPAWKMSSVLLYLPLLVYASAPYFNVDVVIFQ